MAQTNQSTVDREVELRKKFCDAQYGEIYTEAEYNGSAKVYVNSSELKAFEDGKCAVTLENGEHEISYTKGITRVKQTVSKDTILENSKPDIQVGVSSKRDGLDISIDIPSNDNQFGS